MKAELAKASWLYQSRADVCFGWVLWSDPCLSHNTDCRLHACVYLPGRGNLVTAGASFPFNWEEGSYPGVPWAPQLNVVLLIGFMLSLAP